MLSNLNIFLYLHFKKKINIVYKMAIKPSNCFPQWTKTDFLRRYLISYFRLEDFYVVWSANSPLTYFLNASVYEKIDEAFKGELIIQMCCNDILKKKYRLYVGHRKCPHSSLCNQSPWLSPGGPHTASGRLSRFHMTPGKIGCNLTPSRKSSLAPPLPGHWLGW